MSIWILVTNSAEAKLYQSDNLRVDGLHALKELTHPDSRKKVTDLISDRPGHSQSDAGAHGAYAKGDPKDNEAEHFALQLVKEIKSGHARNDFEQLIVVASVHFYSLMHKHMGDHIPNVTHIAKDYTKYPIKKLTDALREQLFI